ncbi:MAG: HlyD family efflux transporter periplasmic adaptor subunit [Roseitalea porphyridii]|uniref:efflux RND transporter periplasmic adaptor subunit n=1 Tax=Roseitalea porphyridii TaxID=1852022 RepID=UPI0032D90995
MKGAWTKWIVGLIAVAVVGYGIHVSLREQPVLVDLGTISRGAMAVAIDEEGMTRVRDVYAVSSTLAGRIDRIALEEGDTVSRGDVIATIHPLDPPFLDLRTRTELQAAAEAARAAVALANVEHARAQTALNLARSAYERASELAKTNIVSDSELERAFGDLQLKQAQVESALANINLRLAELASVEARLAQPGDEPGNGNGECCVTLRAPIDGIVLGVKVRSEQAVNVGTVVAELGRPDDLEVAVDLLSSDAVRIGPGTTATISDWGGDRDLGATVRKVEPAAFTKVSALGIEEQRVNAVLDLDEVPEGLGHGYRVVARLTVWRADDVVRAPISALYRDDGDWAVFVAEDGVARVRAVELGRMNDTVAEVAAGLAPGERVILYPSDLLRDGRLIADRAAPAGDRN